MAILRTKDARKLEDKELDKRISEFKLELAKERGNIHIGGTVTSPGRIKEIRKTIARVLTIRKEKAAFSSEKKRPQSSAKEVSKK